MKEVLLEIKKLTIGYGTGVNAKKVADNLDTCLFGGELVCLLGANGTGKSTLMRTLCGFQPALQGRVLIGDGDVHLLNERELSRRISVVLTDRVVVPNASVEELVGYGRSPHTGLFGRICEEDRQIIDRAMVLCGIEHKRKDLLSALSDGERQKAFIAKALAQDTPLIVLDEPTAFLDLPARVEIMQLLRHIASGSGKSILMSTHDLDLALQMSDRLWLLRPGGPIQTGSPEDLLLRNAFQTLFQNKGIVFDNRTGLFQVNHQSHGSIAVKGHGFEYVMLRRAFARKGIDLSKADKQSEFWVQVDSGSTKPFSLVFESERLIECASLEDFVDEFFIWQSKMSKCANEVICS